MTALAKLNTQPLDVEFKVTQAELDFFLVSTGIKDVAGLTEHVKAIQAKGYNEVRIFYSFSSCFGWGTMSNSTDHFSA
jgi:hypothetical protein